MKGNAHDRFIKSLNNADRSLAGAVGNLHLACANGVDESLDVIDAIETKLSDLHLMRADLNVVRVNAAKQEELDLASESPADEQAGTGKGR